MGAFDDFKEMAEDVDKMPDEFPEEELKKELKGGPEPEEDSQDAEGATVPEALDTEEVNVGGLGRSVDEPEEDDLSVEKLLGLTGKDQEGERSPKQDEQTEADTGQEQAPSEPRQPQAGSMEARLQELAETNRRLIEQNDMLMKRALSDQRQQPPVEQEQAPKLDQDALDYLTPLVKHIIDGDIEELRQDVRPLKETVHDQQLGEFLSTQVPGFRPGDVKLLRQELEKMPESEQALYREGVAGAALLAMKLQSRGAVGAQKKQKQQVSPLAARHVSESAGTTRDDPDAVSDDEKIRRLNATPDEDILALMERLEGYE